MNPAPFTLPLNTVDGLNHGCYCRTLNQDLLRERLESDPGLTGLSRSIALTRPNLFSATAVFLARATADAIAAAVAAIERIVALPHDQSAAVSRAPHNAQ